MPSNLWHSIIGRAQSLYSDFQEFLAPSSCLCCNRARDFEDKFLCPDCLRSLVEKNTGFGPVCPFCGKPNNGSACVSCHPPADLDLYYWGLYDNKLKACILQFKFHHARQLGIKLIEMAHSSMSGPISNIGFDLIVPVPLHRKRQRRREYNQSEVLASRLAELCEIDFAPSCLKRVRSTFQQAKLPEERRWHNVKDAFSVPKDYETKVAKRHILLIDDIITTGATVHEASRALMAAGAGKVTIFGLAYTP